MCMMKDRSILYAKKAAVATTAAFLDNWADLKSCFLEQIKIENLYLLCADLKKIRATHFLQGELASPCNK